MDIKKFFEDLNAYVTEEKQKMPYNFNLLDEQCGHIVENSHTNILMKLLQYKNQHGYVFLESFFNYIGWNIEIDKNKNNPVIIKTEKKTEQKTNGRIDGFIYQKNQFAVIIENKINGAGNQEEQLKRYIEDVKLKQDINEGQIWVVFLTKNGKENPDTDSIQYMKDCGIMQDCNSDDEIDGPRYAAINYCDHILPWLRDEIQPCVMQKDIVLNTGVLQYIDFLEGFLGLRKSEAEMLKKCKDWVKQSLHLDICESKKEYKGYYEILDNNLNNNELKESDDKGEEFDEEKINIIDNIVGELYDEPLKKFYDITKKYFAENLGMTECVISHPNKSFRFIQIRDASWPIYVHFEWFPLAIYQSPNTKNALYFHAEKRYSEMFNYLEKNRRRSIREFYKKGTTPILLMPDDKLEDYLKEAYGTITKDFIKKINNILFGADATITHQRIVTPAGELL